MGPRRNLLQRSRYQGPNPWPPAVWEGSQGKETTLINKLDTSLRGKRVINNHSLHCHHAYECHHRGKEHGVQGGRCLLLDNKGHLWADVSTCS